MAAQNAQLLRVAEELFLSDTPLSRVLSINREATPQEILDVSLQFLELAKDVGDQLANDAAEKGKTDIPNAYYAPGCLVELARGLISSLSPVPN